jgi:hypothetical protein
MSNSGVTTIPNFELYYRTVAIKIAWYGHKNRYEDQWKRTEHPDMNPCNYAHLIFDKVAQKHKTEKKTASSTNVVGKTG